MPILANSKTSSTRGQMASVLMATIALTVLAASVSMVAMQQKSLRRAVRLSDETTVFHYVSRRVSCSDSLSPLPAACATNDVIETRWTDGSVVTAADGTTNVQGYQVRARCDSGTIHLEANGGGVSGWRSLANGIPVNCDATETPSGGGGGSPHPNTTIFLTSKIYGSDLRLFSLGIMSGPDGADWRCQKHATDAGLTGTWRAHLSSQSQHAYNRIPTSVTPLVNSIGDTVAANMGGLYVFGLSPGLHYGENGEDYSGCGVTMFWSGSDGGGQRRMTANNWRSSFMGASIGEFKSSSYFYGTFFGVCASCTLRLLCVKTAN